VLRKRKISQSSKMHGLSMLEIPASALHNACTLNVCLSFENQILFSLNYI